MDKAGHGKGKLVQSAKCRVQSGQRGMSRPRFIVHYALCILHSIPMPGFVHLWHLVGPSPGSAGGRKAGETDHPGQTMNERLTDNQEHDERTGESGGRGPDGPSRLASPRNEEGHPRGALCDSGYLRSPRRLMVER